MKKYICKYCGKSVVNDYGFGGIGYLPTMIDHLLLAHRDHYSEFGQYYISDIPSVCYSVRTEEEGVAKKKVNKTVTVMHPNLT